MSDDYKAIRYNEKQACVPSHFVCQSTGRVIQKGTLEALAWVRMHQRALSLHPDGMIGPQTQQALMSRYGPFAQCMLTDHMMPVYVRRWGYDHAHDHGSLDWPAPEPEWQRHTAKLDWRSGMMRLVSGYTPPRQGSMSGLGTFSRGPRSVISLDTLSIGIAHFWAATIPAHMVGMFSRVPKLCLYAFMLHADKPLDDRDWWAGQVPQRKGKGPITVDLAWFVSGWRWLLSQPDAMTAHADLWLAKYARKAVKIASSHFGASSLQSRDGGIILAAVTRMTNSGPANRWIKAAKKRVGRRSNPRDILEDAFLTSRSDGGYGKPDRWEKIVTWKQFTQPVPKELL